MESRAAVNDDDNIKSCTTYAYVVRDFDTLYLDFYTPSTPRGDSACVVYFYGGGFISGARDDKQTCLDVEALLQRGFAVAAVDYRKYLSMVDFTKTPKVRWLNLLDTTVSIAAADCAAALSFVASHAGMLSISVSNIVLTGSSAGGIAVLQYDYERLTNSPIAYGCSLKDSKLNVPELAGNKNNGQTMAVKPAAVVAFAGGVFTHSERLKYLDVSKFINGELRPVPTAFFYGEVDKVVYRKHLNILGSHFVGCQALTSLFARNGFEYRSYCFANHGHEVSNYLYRVIDDYVEFVDAALVHNVVSGEKVCNYDFLPITKASQLTLIGILTSDKGFVGLFDEEK